MRWGFRLGMREMDPPNFEYGMVHSRKTGEFGAALPPTGKNFEVAQVRFWEGNCAEMDGGGATCVPECPTGSHQTGRRAGMW